MTAPTGVVQPDPLPARSAPPLAGRCALVTGASRGIGRAIAMQLANAGARVVCSSRKAASLEALIAELPTAAASHEVLVMDVGKASSRAEALAELEQRGIAVDILVNNAGIAESKPYHRTDDELWERTMRVNATGVFALCRTLVPRMVKRGWGRAIIIASNAGLTGYAYSSAYCASKHAVLGMMRAIAIEIARSPVTINALCPGWVDTDMARGAVDRIASSTGKTAAEARQALERMSPQQRWVQPEEVAMMVEMLCQENARSIHGQAIAIDGGQVMR